VTKEQILAMKAGSVELDSAVHREVMGKGEPTLIHPLPPYSSDTAAAWRVLGEFTTKKYSFAFVWCVRHWLAGIDVVDEDGHGIGCLASVTAEEFPLAVCQAALLAKLEEE